MFTAPLAADDNGVQPSHLGHQDPHGSAGCRSQGDARLALAPAGKAMLRRAPPRPPGRCKCNWLPTFELTSVRPSKTPAA